MLLIRFYDPALAQASYLIGCQATGEAVVVDPNRDADQYVRAAAAEGVRVTHVTETHIHADFVSGARELAARTGARLLLSGEGGPDWGYAYAEPDGARLLADGDVFTVGEVAFDVMHTPGHTPEHLSFLITDTRAAAGPMGILTGDFVFVGDVGRPDLLERAAGVAGAMEAGARTLFRSLECFRRLPDHLQLWPGHGAGSACGKALGAVPSSTVGYEKLANWGLGIVDEAAFVARVLDGQPEPPAYFAEVKRINREGPRVLGGAPCPPRLDACTLDGALRERAVVVDVRPAAAFAAGHVPGTINLPLDRSFTTWAGWLVPYAADIYLIADDEARADEAVRRVRLIGLDRVAGSFDAGVIGEWATAGRTLEVVEQTTAPELAALVARGEAVVVDVRGRAEWEAGHIPGAPNVPVGHLAARAGELPTDRPLVVHCQGGARSAIAASVLQAQGFTNVVNLIGGFAEWQRSGGAVQREGDGPG